MFKVFESKRQDKYRYYLTRYGTWGVCETLRDDYRELPIVKRNIQWWNFCLEEI